MNSKDRVLHYLKNPGVFATKVCGKVLRGTDEADELYLRMAFRSRFGYPLDLKNPKTFNEKLQWLKLHDRNPLYTKLVDKAEVKPWVAERIGWEHVVPTLGVWDSFDEIDFDALPERFVLKCTHDSGGLAICRDRSSFDVLAARRAIEHSLSRNYFQTGREWPYKDVVPRIIAEEYLDPVNEQHEAMAVESNPDDYKIFCFGGEPKALFVATDRASGDTKFDFFDTEWNHMPFTNGHPNAEHEPARPEHLEEMLTYARALSEGMPQVRVDFYEVGNKVYFGEMTFYHWSGMVPFAPEEYDRIFGSWIELPNGENC